MMDMYDEEIDLEGMAMGITPKKCDKGMSMPMKKTKVADHMESLERFALKAANSKALTAEVKSGVKEHVRMIREILAGEYTK